jgi:hypothetical protein
MIDKVIRRAALIVYDQEAAEKGDPRCLNVFLDGEMLPKDRNFRVVGFITWERVGRKVKVRSAFNRPEERIVKLSWGYAIKFANDALQRGSKTEEEIADNAVIFFSTDTKEKEEPKIKIRRA